MLAPRLFAQAAPPREVHGDTLVSTADPAASFVFATAFHSAGWQTIDILQVAGADQYFIIDAAADRSIQRFYWCNRNTNQIGDRRARARRRHGAVNIK